LKVVNEVANTSYDGFFVFLKLNISIRMQLPQSSLWHNRRKFKIIVAVQHT